MTDATNTAAATEAPAAAAAPAAPRITLRSLASDQDGAFSTRARDRVVGLNRTAASFESALNKVLRTNVTLGTSEIGIELLAKARRARAGLAELNAVLARIDGLRANAPAPRPFDPDRYNRGEDGYDDEDGDY